MTTEAVAVEGLIDLHCKQLKLPGVRAAYRELARAALDDGIKPSAFLLSCLEHEVASRTQRRLQQLMRAAKFPAIRRLGDFDFNAIPTLPKAKVLSLADCQFVRRHENVICLGPSGTGKTMIATALGLAAVEAGLRVRFIRTVTLAQELLLAEKEIRLTRYLKSWQRVDLVVLDELGYLQLGSGAPLLFQFMAERHETGSVIVTSNLEFARWAEVLGDATLTTALLDRLTHRAHILIFKGESYRFKESRRRQQSEGA